MNTCSNCGAVVRPGAKFCTSCGTRLNDVSASAASSEWTSGLTAEATSDGPGAPGDTGASPASDDARVEPSATNGSSPSDTAAAAGTSEEASSSWSWRSSSSDPASPAPVAQNGEDGTTEPTSSEEPRVMTVNRSDQTSTSAPDDVASTEEFTWTWGTPDSPDAAADDGTDAPITVAERDAATRVAGETAPMATEPGTDPDDPMRHDQEEPVDPLGDSWGSASTSEGDPNSTLSAPDYEAPDTAASVDDVVDQEAPSGEPGSGAADEDPLDRARRLVEELRTLIPPPRPYQAGQEVAPPAATAHGEGLRDELESARSTSDFGDLRSALESARERPRDVDTMLEMVGRIDTMLEALDDRDRLASAVDRAIGQLGPDAPASIQET